jgi:hypothetical protein
MFQRLSQLWNHRPLSGFLLLGSLLFGLRTLLLPGPRDEIVVDARTVDRVVESRSDLYARELTAEEREDAIRDHVDEEILLREASRRGLHLTSGTARARLVRKMRTGLNAEVPSPTFSQLRAYYAANSERYRLPEGITLVHVFYAADRVGAGDPPSPMDSLAAGADFRALGDAYWLGPVLSGTEERLAGALGPELARQAFDLPPDTWDGPFLSGRGVHYVRVVERYPPAVPELEQIRAQVEFDWLTERRIEVTDRKLQRMSSGYEVIVEAAE